MGQHHDHQHDHGHEHSHGHHHHGGMGHVHAPASFGKAFAIGISLNLAFVVIEVVYGLFGHSMALLADAGHNMSDVLGLVVAWAATRMAKRAPTERFTYGFGSSSILAALFNAVFLLVVIGGLSWAAIQRIMLPEMVAGKTVMVVAAIGILLNGFCAWLFASGSKGDLNIRGAFTHMAADALVSAGVVVAGLVILLTGWQWLDPVVSLVINLIIVAGTWSLLTGAVGMSMDAVPAGVNMPKLRSFLQTLPGVTGLHDLHVWALSTTDTALTCHLTMPDGKPDDDFLKQVCEKLEHHHGIGHATIQIDENNTHVCTLITGGKN